MLGEKLVTLRKKHGYSQQNVADMLSVTRQTISNWECDQGAPALDKAAELARIYKVSLDDLVGNEVEIAAREKKSADLHILKSLIGRQCTLDCDDQDLLMEGIADGRIKILDADEEWLRIEYVRAKGNSLFKKETVVKLIEMSAVQGIEIVEEKGEF